MSVGGARAERWAERWAERRAQRWGGPAELWRDVPWGGFGDCRVEGLWEGGPCLLRTILPHLTQVDCRFQHKWWWGSPTRGGMPGRKKGDLPFKKQ